MQNSSAKQTDPPAISWVRDARNLLMLGLRNRLVLASGPVNSPSASES